MDTKKYWEDFFDEDTPDRDIEEAKDYASFWET